MILGFRTTLDLKRNVRFSYIPLYPSEAHTQEPADILENYVSPTVPLISHVLSSQVRPAFQSNMHPKIDPSTGRAFSRIAGGPLASQDLYVSQSWKSSHPGISNVLFWVVAHIKVKTPHVTRGAYTELIQSVDWDRLWYLVIPPAMTLLDDYEAAYKLRGITIISQMLKTVPPDLLRQTGVDDLIFSVGLASCARFQKRRLIAPGESL